MSRAFPGFSDLTPPASAFDQYETFSHIELVLRHIAYASCRLSLGSEADSILENVTVKKGTDTEPRKSLLDATQDRKRRSIDVNEFPESEAPHHLWFATTDELAKVLTTKDNWSSCFQGHFPACSREEVSKRIESLSLLRNRWAHFRPVPPAVADRCFDGIFDYLSVPIVDWWHRYFDSAPIAQNHEIVRAYAESGADGVPLFFPQPGDAYTGFVDNRKILDRGSQIVVLESENAFWFHPLNHGIRDDLTLSDAIKFAREVGGNAIHVAFVYDKLSPSSEIALHECRVSFRKSDDVSSLVNGLVQLSNSMLRRPRRRVPIADTQLDPNVVREKLFYEAPFNVIVAPTHEQSNQGRAEKG